MSDGSIVIPENQLIKQRLERIAWLLDSVIPLPGGFKIGLDALIGFIPIIGDAFTALLSTYVIGVGIQYGAPKSVISKMIANVILDALLGMIPILGDFFDVVNQANVKNVNLLKEYLEQPREVKRSSRIWLAATILALLCMTAFSIWLAGFIFKTLFNFI